MTSQPHDARADEVDRIVLGWENARPDFPLAPLAVLSRVTRLARLLDIARRDAFATAELEAWEFDVLSALRRSGDGALSPGALIRQTLVTSGTMTTRIDKLEARGLVRRVADPEDRRGRLIHLEPEGERRVDTAMEALLVEEERLLAPLPAHTQSEVADALRTLLLTVEPREQ